MQPHYVQRHLEWLYGLPPGTSVAPFIFSDQQLAAVLFSASERASAAEALFICQRGDELELSVFIDSSVLEKLRRIGPASALRIEDLAEFWLLVEGVSHFVRVSHAAAHRRAITALELELQAEIDKFVSAVLFLQRGGVRAAEEIWIQLFRNTRFDERLSVSQQRTYRDASDAAAGYCRWLLERYFARGRALAAVRSLRSFFHASRSEKLRRAEGLIS